MIWPPRMIEPPVRMIILIVLALVEACPYFFLGIARLTDFLVAQTIIIGILVGKPDELDRRVFFTETAQQMVCKPIFLTVPAVLQQYKSAVSHEPHSITGGPCIHIVYQPGV